MVVPTPICPLEFDPQHQSVPSLLVAQTCPDPELSTAHVKSSDTFAGTSDSSGALKPKPSWPLKFCPQHHRLLSSFLAHVWYAPADTTAQSASVTWTIWPLVATFP